MSIYGQDKNMMNRLKKDLNNQFRMNNLGPSQQILGMNIMHDEKNKRLWLSQEKYIEKVIDMFHMKDSKLVGTPLVSHF